MLRPQLWSPALVSRVSYDHQPITRYRRAHLSRSKNNSENGGSDHLVDSLSDQTFDVEQGKQITIFIRWILIDGLYGIAKKKKWIETLTEPEKTKPLFTKVYKEEHKTSTRCLWREPYSPTVFMQDRNPSFFFFFFFQVKIHIAAWATFHFQLHVTASLVSCLIFIFHSTRRWFDL